MSNPAPLLVVGALVLLGLGGHAGFSRQSSSSRQSGSSVLQVPSMVAVASGPVTVGAAVSDTAVLSGGDGPTGTITFQLYGPADPNCAGSPVFASTVSVNGDGSFQSARFAPRRPGIYQWTASYTGDTNNLFVPPICPSGGESVAVLVGVPSLVATAPESLPLGAPLTETAVIAGGSKPTGTLIFTLFGPQDTTCSGSPQFTFAPVAVTGDGTYRAGPLTPATVGVFHFQVRYSGDANNIALSTRCESTAQHTAVVPVVLTISGQPSPPLSVGEEMVGREVLSGGSEPTGTIIFTIFGPHDATCIRPPAYASPPVAVTGNGTFASHPFTPTAPGFYNIVATYSGDSSNAAQQTPCGDPAQTVSVSRAILTIAARTAATAIVGQRVRTAETFSGGLRPTGTVTFSFYSPSDSTCTREPLLASPPQPVTGDATYSSPPFTPPAAGDYRFVAAYSGDANNVASTTDCNAINQAVLARVPGLYDPTAHPRSVIQLEVVAFALLALAGPSGTNRRHQASTTQSSTTQSSTAQSSKSQGSVVATGLDNTAEGWEAVAVIAAASVPSASGSADRLENSYRGDGSHSWQWPGTRRLDDLSIKLPKRVAPASPLVARITNDAGYLRAMFGSASALLPIVGAALAVFAVFRVHGNAVPPPFALAMALAVVGVLDAMAGFVAVTVFVVGVIALGGVTTSNDARTLLGLSSLWFAAPIIAGVARPLRREPTRSTAEHVERGADVIVAALVGAWAVKSIIGGLPGLSGRTLPITNHANVAALIVLAALGLRMIVETIAAHHYPVRLAEVQPDALPVSGRAQHITSALMGVAIFIFVALPYVGSCWELYVGGAFFAVPILLKLNADRLPNYPKLYAVIPRGILETVVMLVVGTVFGAFVAEQLGHQSNQQTIRESFLLLSIPALAVSVLQLFGRDGPQPPKIHWLPEKILGAALVALGTLFVLGIVTI